MVAVGGRARAAGVLCSSWWPGCFIINLGEMVSQEVVESVNDASL